MYLSEFLKRKVVPALLILLTASVVLSACAGNATSKVQVSPTPKHTPTPTPSPSPTPIPPTPTPTYPPVVPPTQILGVNGNPGADYGGIPWIRLSYLTCGGGDPKGDDLKNAIQSFHLKGIRVMLSVCQWSRGDNLLDMAPLNDAVQGGPDALQCGNEQMKDGPDNRYVDPTLFARFFDNCVKAMHNVRPEVPVIIGALDPHVGGIDYAPLYNQVAYLNSMQYAMNTVVHPGGNWNWRTQIVGLIDSWHNGYPNASVNSLYYLFLFWAQQFGADLDSGGLGKHLWVIEGTGCFKGCGINPYNSYEVAVSHIFALILDVRTAMHYHVPFFYFSGRDFQASGYYWPIGILDVNGHAKPLRQDLGMGAVTLTMSCSGGQQIVKDQLQLLYRMYSGCVLPENYTGILAS